MSEAENLLNTLDDISVATADPTTEEHIVIDSNRNIYVPEALRRIAVQYDHNIETVTFDCPRYWDGIDMSGMKAYINYRRSDGELGQYHAEITNDEQWYMCQQVSGTEYEPSSSPIDFSGYEPYTFTEIDGCLTTDGRPVYKLTTNIGTPMSFEFTVCNNQGDPGIMHFDWTISRNVTEVKGPLSFLVCINTTDDEGNEVHHWNSELNQQMTISEGLEVDNYIVDEYSDVITQLLIRMDTVETDNAATRDYIDDGIDKTVNEVVTQKIVDGTFTGVDLSDYATNEALNNEWNDLNDKIYGHDTRIQNLESAVNTNAIDINDLNGRLEDAEQHLDAIADYVIETGTIDDQPSFQYELWNSGKAVAWFSVNVSALSGKSQATHALPQWPTKLFKNYQPDHVYLSEEIDPNVNKRPINTAHMLYHDRSNNGIVIDLADAIAFGGGESITVHVYAIGRWE